MMTLRKRPDCMEKDMAGLCNPLEREGNIDRTALRWSTARRVLLVSPAGSESGEKRPAFSVLFVTPECKDHFFRCTQVKHVDSVIVPSALLFLCCAPSVRERVNSSFFFTFFFIF